MWALVIGSAILFCFYNLFCKTSRLPPGPTPLPIIGNLISILTNLRRFKYNHEVWRSWSRKYGDIFSMRLGFTTYVVVSGVDLIREVSTNSVFDGRPSGLFYLLRSLNKKLGIIFSDGKSWTVTRRVALKYMKNFGYGTSHMESMITEECRALVEMRVADAGQPITTDKMFDVSVINILWQIVSSKRYDLNDPQLLYLCALIRRTFKVTDMSGGILNIMPYLKYIVPDLIGYTEIMEIHEKIFEFIRKVIDEHREDIDLQNPRDIIDSFLIEIKKQSSKISDEELLVVCRDLLEAGVETTSNTLEYLLLYIVRDEEVQSRMQREIDEVVGKDRTPTLSDKLRMAYTEAVILETLRISSVAPVGIPHRALEDTCLGKYVIPKDTVILLNMYDLHHGINWEQPDSFRPSRFLNKDGHLVLNECLMPFGTGKRRCMGEGLARSEIFLFITHLLQRFHIILPKNYGLPSTDPIDGVTLSPKPFKIIFQERFQA